MTEVDPSSSSDDDIATKRHKTATQRKEIWEQIDLDRLIFSYGIKLSKPHRLPPKYAYLTDENANCFDKFESLCAEDFLEMLLSFLFTENIPSTKAVIDEVLKDRAMRGLELLLRSQSFTPTDFKPEEACSVDFVKYLGRKITEIQEMLADKSQPANNKIEHENVKDFFGQFGVCIIRDGTMYSGTRVLPVLVDYLPVLVEAKVIVIQPAKVIVRPDLLFGASYNPVAVPLEIYAPHVYQKDTVCPYHGSETENSDDEDVTLPIFLANLPTFRGPARAVRHFSCKLTVQCLLQLIGCCNEYIRIKIANSDTGLCKERRSFIGVFAHRFDVYFLKLDASESDYCLASVVSGKPKHPITLQYFPVPLNMCNPNHAAAFAFFLKYYRNIYKAQN